MSSVSATIDSAVTATVTMAVPGISTCPMEAFGTVKNGGMTCAPAPKIICAAFSKRKEIPIAVMSREMRGEFLSGL